MVGGEKWWITPEDGGNLRLAFKFAVEKGAHRASIPALGMDEIQVERQVAWGKGGAG